MLSSGTSNLKLNLYTHTHTAKSQRDKKNICIFVRAFWAYTWCKKNEQINLWPPEKILYNIYIWHIGMLKLKRNLSLWIQMRQINVPPILKTVHSFGYWYTHFEHFTTENFGWKFNIALSFLCVFVSHSLVAYLFINILKEPSLVFATINKIYLRCISMVMFCCV